MSIPQHPRISAIQPTADPGRTGDQDDGPPAVVADLATIGIANAADALKNGIAEALAGGEMSGRLAGRIRELGSDLASWGRRHPVAAGCAVGVLCATSVALIVALRHAAERRAREAGAGHLTSDELPEPGPRE